jgi:hypothetical protein
VSFTPYNFRTDSAGVALILDGSSTLSTSGSQVTGWSDVGPAANGFNAVTGTGTGVTSGTDSNGHRYLNFDGASTLQIPSGTAFDAVFTGGATADPNTTPSGWGMLVVCEVASIQAGWLLSKQPSFANFYPVQLCLYNGGGNGFAQRFTFGPVSHRAYPIGSIFSVAIGHEYLTDRSNLSDENPVSVHTSYRDGATIYTNGAPSIKYHDPGGSGSSVDPITSVGQPLTIGSWASQFVAARIYAVVVWNRTPHHDEILATERYYRAALGAPEVLTNQTFALVAESNSEACNPQTDTEPGMFDDAIASLGSSNNACFMLGQPSRSGHDIVSDFSTWSLPLIEYLQSLGLQTAVHFWELINDGYGTFGAAAYTQYQAEIIAAGLAGVCYSVSTVMSSSTYTTSHGASGTNPICAANNQVISDGTANDYPVSTLYLDTNLGTFNSSNYTDGIHVTTAAVTSYADPYFVTAIGASLVTGPSLALSGPTTGTASLPSTNFTVTGTSLTSSTTVTPNDSSAGGTFTPTSLTLTSGSPTGTFTYTAPSPGTYSIAIMGATLDAITGSPISYVASAEPTCVAPVFSPAAGSFSSVQSVTITSSTGGAAIHYTTDGTTPTSGSTLYTGALTIGSTLTLKGLATLTGHLDSTVTSGLYTITIPPPPGLTVTTPSSAVPSASGVTVDLKGTSTHWLTASPTFTALLGTIASQSVLTDTTATLSYTAPSSPGTEVFTDSTTSATAPMSIHNPGKNRPRWFPGLTRPRGMLR